MILETAPDSDKGEWDLSKLKQVISNDELRARAAGENLGTKLNLTSEPNTLAIDSQYCQGRRKDTNDPQWLA